MGRREVKVSDHTVLLSVHEVTPAYEDDVVKSCDMLDDIGITDYTLLVVPFFGMKMANSFEKHELFTDYLKSLGVELSLHGYSHYSKSGSPDEFKGIPYERMISRLRLGFSLFEKAFGHRPTGVVPPMWSASSRLASASLQLGLQYCVIENRIHSEDQQVHTTSQRIVSSGSGDIPSMNALVEIELGGSVQVAIHPADYHYNRMRELLLDLRDRLDYSFTGYASYLFGRK
jgi:predicted deacetylase